MPYIHPETGLVFDDAEALAFTRAEADRQGCPFCQITNVHVKSLDRKRSNAECRECHSLFAFHVLRWVEAG